MGGKSWVAIYPFIHWIIHAIMSIGHLHVPSTVLGRRGSQRPPCLLEFKAMRGLDLV